MTDLIQVRRGTSAEWAAANPVLAVAEPGFDTTTGTFKLGNGVTAWSGLAATGGVAGLQSVFAGVFAPLALGWVAQAFVTADQSAIGAGPSNMSGFDLTFTAVAGRRYKFTSVVHLVPSAASTWYVDLLDGATNLGRMAQHNLGNTGLRCTGAMITAAALSAGSHTLHMSIARAGGTGTCDSAASGSLNSFLLVEDIGVF